MMDAAEMKSTIVQASDKYKEARRHKENQERSKTG